MTTESLNFAVISAVPCLHVESSTSSVRFLASRARTKGIRTTGSDGEDTVNGLRRKRLVPRAAITDDLRRKFVLHRSLVKVVVADLLGVPKEVQSKAGEGNLRVVHLDAVSPRRLGPGYLVQFAEHVVRRSWIVRC